MNPKQRKTLLIAGSLIALAVLLVNEWRIAGILAEEGQTGTALFWYRLRVWIAAGGTLAVFSFLFRDNPLYRGFEHALLGSATGMAVAIVVRDVLYSKWWAPMTDGFRVLASEGVSAPALLPALLLIPGLIGMLWYFQYSKKYFWLSRIAMCVSLGAGTGLGIKRLFNELMPQVTGTFKPLWVGPDLLRDVSTWERVGLSFENLVFVLGTLTVLVYFFFAFGRKNLGVKGTAKLGRWYLMISLGAFFGNTFMTRLSALIERVHFLFSEWLRWSAM